LLAQPRKTNTKPHNTTLSTKHSDHKMVNSKLTAYQIKCHQHNLCEARWQTNIADSNLSM